MNIKNIVKSDGSVVPFDAEKMNKMARWASDRKVNWSSVALQALKKLSDGCSTKDINKALIDTCAEAFDEKHFLLAGRILAGMIYKEAFGGKSKIPTLREHHDNMVELKYWELLPYNDVEFALLESEISHNKDLGYSYPEIKQINDKYVIRNRVEGRSLESPQFMYMGMAMANMKSMPEDRRLKDVITLYHYLSDKKICAPTPFMGQLRTPDRSYASCAIFTTEDTAKSLAAGDHIAYMLTCASAGIGAHLKTRSKGDEVRGGTTIHQGKRPYYVMTESAVAANLQNCYSEDTEILTDKGFRLFTDLTDNSKVAQVQDDGSLSFVFPEERQVFDYKGDMYNFKTERNMGVDLLVTPNHRMTWKHGKHVASDSRKQELLSKGYTEGQQKHYLNAPTFESTLAVDFEPKRKHVMFFGGDIKGEIKTLSTLERFKIAFQADGVKKPAGNFAYSFHFSKDRKVKRLKEILSDLPYEVTESVYSDGTFGFYVKVGYELKGDFSDFTLEDKSADWCVEFLRELNHWDGTTSNDTSKDVVRFFSVDKTPVKFVEAVAASCGAYCATTLKENTNPSWKHIYSLYISFDKKETTGRAIDKNLVENYNGKVYCVTVETGNIVVRRNGKSSICGNSRGGSATMHVNVLDPEIEDIITWKSKKTATKVRVDGIHYSVGYNLLFAKKVQKGEKWMLISYKDAADLHEAMYEGDQTLFEVLYNEYETSDVKKSLIDARELAVEFLVQGQESGQIYLHRTDEMNRHTPHKDKIYSSNLCQETGFPSKGYRSVEDLYKEGHVEGDPEIGLCSLSAIVARRVSKEAWEDVAYYCALMIDNVMDIMDYPFPHLKYTAQARRNIGVGITDLAGLMAEEGLKYSSLEGKQYIHRLAELHSYSMIKASLRLAKERGVCNWMHKTKWVDGWLPVDTMNKNVFKIIQQPLLQDWESLRKEVVENGGIRNSCLINFMPNESSSVATNGTNSILPARAIKVVKTNGSKMTRFLVPNSDTLSDKYELAWDIKTRDLVDVYACIQAFTDQSISADMYLDFTKEDITGADMLKDWLYMTSMGMKTRYYINSKTNSGKKEDKLPEVEEEVGCGGGGCAL